MLADHVQPAVYPMRMPLAVTAWQAPGEPVPVATGMAAAHEPISPGTPWGRPWSTWWFELSGTVPAEYAGRIVEVVIDLGFGTSQPGFSAEGMLYDVHGVPLKGVHPCNRWYRVSESAAGGESIQLHLEAAANPTVLDGSFRPTPLGDPATAGSDPLYRLGAVELCVFGPEVFALAMDLDVLLDLAQELPADDARRAQVLAAVGDALVTIDVRDLPGSAFAARAVLAPALSAPARASAQQLTAVAHAHIDSAWLWPVRETRRKCARTFANVTALAEYYPELVFACSSAQQYRWIRDEVPQVWERIVAAAQEGSWEPVGGMWVEPDGVIPSGESLARQLLYGQRFFRAEFGKVCSGMWLPDSFGYSGSYPQIATLGRAQWFLTQKISWNDTNTFPHHTFWWEGIDGTRILTHFPPADTYNADLGGADVHRSSRQFLDKARSRKSLVPFGFGDGGGGPEREMLERARRLADLDGSPQVQLGTAAGFFSGLREEYGAAAPTWTGELYLELHRGTLTSQRGMKAGNRRCEALLRQAELVWTMAVVRGLAEWPGAELAEIWERVLLLQFHDILPGSSIAWVHAEANADYARLGEKLDALIAEGLRLLGGGVLNAGPFARRELITVSGTPTLVAAPALSSGAAVEVEAEHPCTLSREGSGVTLSNGLVSLSVDAGGTLSSIVDHRHGDRQVLPAGLPGAELRLHQDVPLKWDAWDLDKAHALRWCSPVAEGVSVVDEGPLRVSLETTATVGSSAIVQRLTITADSPRIDVEVHVDWRERDRALAAYLPVSVLAHESTAEIQYGHLRRPTHENTSWEAARFEMVAHRWLHVGETGWGVGVVNESTYGHSVRRTVTDSGENVTMLRLTLLRSPQFPDPHADAGSHVLRFGIVPGADVAETIRHGYAVNLPLVAQPAAAGTGAGAPFVTVDDPGAVIEAVKLAEDGSGDVIVRLYESLGGRRRVSLRPAFEVAAVVETDLLEEDSAVLDGRRALLPGSDPAAMPIELALKPFQLVTLRLTPTG